jgi:hypothetical protein
MVYTLRDTYGRKYPVRTKIQIGSDLRNQVVLLDPQVAPMHATLWEQGGNLFLQNTSGSSATFVNQKPIQETVTLRMGDQLIIGSTLFTVDDFNADLPPAAAEAPKKGIGCMKWLLIGAAMFIVEVLCLAAGGFYLYNTDVEIQGSLMDLNDTLSASPVSAGSMPTVTDLPGPAILNLNDTWIKSAIIGNDGGFSQHDERTVEGLTPAGAAIKTSFVFDTIEQVYPEWMSYNLVQKITNGKVVDQYESGIVKGVVYSGTQTCESSPDPKDGEHGRDPTPENIFTKVLTGHVKQVETGVTIKGIVTDRYELRRDNFMSSDTVVEVKSGSLYRARDGGYLVQLEYVVVIKPQSWAINMSDEYSTTEPALVTVYFDRTYAPGGTLAAKVPPVCASQVK